MHAFILAGGFATRLWPLTEKRAKPLLPLAGKPIINYLIESIPATIPIIVSTNSAFGADFIAWKNTYGFTNVQVVIEQSTNDDKKLGTLGALSQWLRTANVHDDIFLLAGDNYFGQPLQSIINAYDGNTPLVATYDLQSLAEATAFGTVLTDGDFIAGFEEKPLEPKSSIISTGASIIPKDYLPILHEFAAIKPDNIGGIFEEFLQRGIAMHHCNSTEAWFDIGSFWAYLEATNYVLQNKPICTDSSVLNNTQLLGASVIGEQVQLQDCVLTNTVVFGNATLTNCVLENCIIDTNCTLQNIDLTGKMLRADSRLVQHSLSLPVPLF
jgi:glucose-1-phosphate thymidylyltransferase